MGVFAYFVYAIFAFVCYMAYILDFEIFKQVVLPWTLFIIILFAPLLWTHIRTEKAVKNETVR